VKDRKHFHTPVCTVGPLERGLRLIKATNSGENFEGWVVGFYGEWSDTLAKLPMAEKLADAQVVRWQSKYGREPTIQQRAWLLVVSKVRLDIAMMATKLNAAQVIIKNLQNMPPAAREVPPAHGGAEKDGTGVSGLGPPARQGTVTTHGRTDRTIGWRSWLSPGTGKTRAPQRTQLSLMGPALDAKLNLINRNSIRLS
jgi:hypothetical protein